MMVDDSAPLSRSRSLFAEPRLFAYEPPTLTFESSLMNATKKMCCDFDVLLKRVWRRHATLGPGSLNESLMQSDRQISGNTSLFDHTKRRPSLASDIEVTLEMIYDGSKRLTELMMQHQRVVPRELLQIIGYIIPGYRNLTKFTFKYCRLNKYTVYEMVKVVVASFISELCFDGSTLSEGNYALLLSVGSLKALSLSRCGINDIVCDEIAAKLDYFENRSLLLLNLSMNVIGDQGAKAIAWALRSNRALRHLNLAGNQITDEGALCLFDSLMMFPLTYEECAGKRVRYLQYLNNVVQLTREIMENGVAVGQKYRSRIKRNSKAASKDITVDKARADALAAESIGPFTDPFNFRSTALRNGYRHCVGNMTLSYLNVAYNNLAYPSLKKLQEVVRYQRMRREPAQVGLIRLVIDGNNLPVDSVEYHIINDIMSQYINIRTSTSSRKREDRKNRSRVTIARR